MTWTILAFLVACLFAGWTWLWYCQCLEREEDLAQLKESLDRAIQSNRNLNEDFDSTSKKARELLHKDDLRIQRLSTKLLKARALTGELRKGLDSVKRACNQSVAHAHQMRLDLESMRLVQEVDRKERLKRDARIKELEQELENQSNAMTLLEQEIQSKSLPVPSSLVTIDQFRLDPARVQWAQQLGKSSYWSDLIGVLTNAFPAAPGKSADYELGLIRGVQTAVSLLLSLSKHPVTSVDAPEPDYGAEGVMKAWDKDMPVDPDPALPDPDVPVTFHPDDHV